MERRSCLTTILGGIMLMMVGCTTVPTPPLCGPNDKPQRWTEAQIDAMSDDQVTQELARNEELVRRGCATPNAFTMDRAKGFSAVRGLSEKERLQRQQKLLP